MENFKIIGEKENLLFKRKEIKFTIDAEVTPSRAAVEKLISEKFSTQPKNIKIKNILGKFGSKTFTVSVNIYASKEDKESIEPKSKKDASAQPEQPVEAPAPQETPAQIKESKPEEKPEEQPKPEEKPAEEPKSKEKTE